jgi:hypothetical protein
MNRSSRSAVLLLSLVGCHAEAAGPAASPQTPEPMPVPVEAKPADRGGDRSFDRGAASATLAAAAGAARACKRDGGPTGTARVRATFAPGGSVTSASVEGPFAGTAVGDCIVAAFRGARVPAFDGVPVAVSKTVSVN